MLLGTNNNNTMQTQPDHNSQPFKLNTTPGSTSPTKKFPTILKILLSFLILQLATSIAVLILKIIYTFIGYTGITTTTVDIPNCSSYYTDLQLYADNHLNMFRLTFTSICLCILLTLIILIITIKLLYSSIKLPQNYYPTYSHTLSKPISQQSILILSIQQLYLIIGPKTRALLYILQSICILSSCIVLGQYLIYYLQFTLKNCPILNNITNISIMQNIMIILIISGILFIICWIIWIIIVIINIKNRKDQYIQQRQRQQQKQSSIKQQKKYQPIQNNNTITQYNDNTRKQLIKQENNTNKKQIIAYGYYDPLKDKYQQADPQKINKIGTLDSQNQRDKYQYQNQYGKKRNIFDSQHVEESPSKYNSYSKEKQKQRQRQYNNPVFQKKRQLLYQSPYDRIQHGKYYQGDPYSKNDQNKGKTLPSYTYVNQSQKDNQFKRSRFNSNPNDYNSKYQQQDPYLTTLSKYRPEQNQRDLFKGNQSRKILPQSNYSNSGGNTAGGPSYQGGRPKLHTTYFKDQTSLRNKIRTQNTEEKKKRKGILNDYIRGKYIEN